MLNRLLFISIIITLIGPFVFAQNSKYLVHLKNGSVIEGDIVETTPNSSLIMETKQGQIMTFSRDQILKITLEKSQSCLFCP